MLRTPKGWTGPRELNGVRIEGTFRSHQVPLPAVREDPQQLAMLEQWMRSYRPEELFDERGTPVAKVTSLAPRGDRCLDGIRRSADRRRDRVGRQDALERGAAVQ